MSDWPTVEHLRRAAEVHRDAGRPVAAEHAYRRALAAATECDDCGGIAGTVRTELAELLVTLGRDGDAARVGSSPR